MAQITLLNSGISDASSGSTDLNGYGFIDNPLITNFESRRDNPADQNDVAVPNGSQENFSLNLNGTSQFLEGTLDPGAEAIIGNPDYTFTGWVKFNTWNAFVNPTYTSEYRELVNTRYASGAIGDPGVYQALDDAANATPGFSIGVFIDGAGDHFWAINCDGSLGDKDVDATDSIALDVWYWIALVKTGTGASFYVKETAAAGDSAPITGSDVPLLTLTALPNQDFSGPIKIGHSDTDVTYYFDCQVLDFQLWKEALSLSSLIDVQYSVLVPPQSKTAGLRYYFRFNPEFNNVARDSNYRKNDFYYENFDGNPYVQDSPWSVGDTTLRTLIFAGNDEYLRRFDNSNAADSTAGEGIDAPGNLYNFRSSYAIECWVKLTSLPTGADKMGIWSKWLATGTPANDRGIKLEVIEDAGVAKFQFTSQSNGLDDEFDTSTPYLFTPSTAIAAGKWYHVAVVKDVSGTMDAGVKNHHFFLYDGENGAVHPGNDVTDKGTGGWASVGIAIYQPTVDFIIGASHDWNVSAVIQNFLNGQMMAFRAYQTKRTEALIVEFRNQLIDF